MLFIAGPRGNEIGDFTESIEKEYMDRNFLLRILQYKEFFDTLVPSIENVDSKDFMGFVLKTAHETKFKEETIEYLDDLGKEEFGLKRDNESKESEEHKEKGGYYGSKNSINSF